jgi:hypothetical protein
MHDKRISFACEMLQHKIENHSTVNRQFLVRFANFRWNLWFWTTLLLVERKHLVVVYSNDFDWENTNWHGQTINYCRMSEKDWNEIRQWKEIQNITLLFLPLNRSTARPPSIPIPCAKTLLARHFDLTAAVEVGTPQCNPHWWWARLWTIWLSSTIH